MSDDGGWGGIPGAGCIALHGGVLAVIFSLSLFLPRSLCLSLYVARVVLITALRSGLAFALSSVDIRIADTLLLFINLHYVCHLAS
jgi:hypothetical protein